MTNGSFEGVFVPYMINQAKMPFSVTSAYTHYKIEGNRMVPDNGPESRRLRNEAEETRQLIKRILSRYQRGMRIPRTWVRNIKEQTNLVIVLRDNRCITKEWDEQFHRMVRWLEGLEA